MRHSFVMIVALSLISLTSAHAAEKQEWRCGWFDNPTPANAWLTDRDGDWLIAVQGGYQADGDWPEFNDETWIHTNGGSYGYGCACIKGVYDSKDKKLRTILATRVKPLAACQNDRSLQTRDLKSLQ